MSLIITNGKVWYKNQWQLKEIYIESGIFQKIDDVISPSIYSRSNPRIIDAKGKIVIPGMLDVHVHLREPGFEYKETLETGLRAAVRGGFTTVAAMPNTSPVCDRSDIITSLIAKSVKINSAKLLPIGAITYGEKGLEIADLEQMKAAGAIAFSDDGKGIQSSAIMKKAMEKAKKLELPIFSHCEDESLAGNGVIHSGELAKQLQIPIISSESEYIPLARDLLLAQLTGVHYHVCHISTKESVQLVREAKLRGVKVTAEVTPHHLLLTEADIKEPLSKYKMNPPLRTEADRQALIKGLIDGTIDMIATDHAPHTEEEKNRGIVKAPFGIVGLETAFPVLYTHLVLKQIITLEQLIKLLTESPAQLLHVESGRIEVGYSADLTIIDLEKEQKVDTNKFFSKGKNTPFADWQLKGWPKTTIVNGEIVWEQREELNHVKR